MMDGSVIVFLCTWFIAYGIQFDFLLYLVATVSVIDSLVLLISETTVLLSIAF
jgi:hypothetical protein